MRIALICQYFHPEIGAPSARLYALAKEWTRLGHEVLAVTAFPNHPTGVIPPHYKRRLVARERMDGFTVLRNWIYATPNEGLLKKTLGHLSFMVSVFFLGGPRLGRVDVIIVSSPAFFAVIAAWLLSIFKRVPLVFEVRDLWPAVFVDLGVLKNRFLIAALEGLELFLYRRSSGVVTVTEAFGKAIVARGIPESKVITVTNGVDVDAYSPGAGDAALRTRLGLGRKFVVLYIGAHGISHALEAVLRAARRFDERDDVAFLFVGEGAQKKMLERLAAKWSLRHVSFLPGQPRDRVVEFYRLADVCLVPLRNIPLFDTFIPSKMFEIMACARPIVASVRGEAADILARSQSAIIVPPEDSAGISAAIATLKEDPLLRQRLGRGGREFVTREYQRRALAARYSQWLGRVLARAL